GRSGEGGGLPAQEFGGDAYREDFLEQAGRLERFQVRCVHLAQGWVEVGLQVSGFGCVPAGPKWIRREGKSVAAEPQPKSWSELHPKSWASIQFLGCFS